MSKIATEQEAYQIGRKGSPVDKKCCTKQRAVELGCNVTTEYDNNQLVQKSDLSHPVLRTMGIYFQGLWYQYGARIPIKNFQPYGEYEAMLGTSFDVKMMWISNYGNCNPNAFWTNSDTLILRFEETSTSVWQFQIDHNEPGQEDLKFLNPHSDTLMFMFD